VQGGAASGNPGLLRRFSQQPSSWSRPGRFSAADRVVLHSYTVLNSCWRLGDVVGRSGTGVRQPGGGSTTDPYALPLTAPAVGPPAMPTHLVGRKCRGHADYVLGLIAVIA